MKCLTLLLSATMAIVGCSSTPVADSRKSESGQEQRLVSTFSRNGVKLEWSCKWFTGITEKTCVKGDIVAIEATGYAPSYGTTEALRETAFGVAHDVALDKLVRFVKQDLTSSRVTNTLTKNVEKANEQIKNNVQGNAEVTDAESATADATSASGDRSNINDTVRTVVENIRTQASGIVRGSNVIDEKIVDKKTVAVTVRWSVQNADQSNGIAAYFK